MQRASRLFNEQQRQHIERAVVEAEAKTSCEIVPVVATASGRYDRPEAIIGLLMATLTAIAIWIIFPRQSNELGSWGGTSLVVELLTLVAGIVIAFVIGVAVGSRIGRLRRLFTSRKEMLEEVSTRAREIFFDTRVHHTRGATGVLIYLSLFERMAVVLGDQEVMDKLGQKFLDELCEQLTDGLKQGSLEDALTSVITHAGEQLAGPLPRAEGDVDELENALILLD